MGWKGSWRRAGVEEEDSALKEGEKVKCGGKRPQPSGRISLSFVFTCFFNPDVELEEEVSRRPSLSGRRPWISMPTQQAGGPGLRNGCRCRSRALNCTPGSSARFLSGSDWMLLAFWACRNRSPAVSVVPVLRSGCVLVWWVGGDAG